MSAQEDAHTFSEEEVNAADLLKRAFGPGTVELDRVYVSDITYVWTWEGWLYLATVLDPVVAAGRRVGHGRPHARLARGRRVDHGLGRTSTGSRADLPLRHGRSRLAQYSSGDFTALLDAQGIVQSFSRPGECWDNAVSESWFSTLKNELIHRQSWPTRDRARRAIFEYIEVFYNRQRLHSSLGYLTPVEYEQQALTIHTPSATQAA